jgi:hypothetical protein
MGSSKRELLFDLLARDRTKQATDSASRNLEDVGDAADDAAKSTDKLSKSSKGAGDSTEKLGKKADENAVRIGKLNREADLLERELHSLARAFTDTDDAAERMDLSRGVRRLENDLRRVNKSKGLLEGIIPDEPDQERSKSWGRKLIAGIGAGITDAGAGVATKAGASVGPVVGGAIAAAAAPVLISSLGSALAAGVGTAGIGAGVALAISKDDQLKQAGGNMAKQVATSFQDSAAKYFSGPVRQSIGILGGAGERVAKQWDGAFKALSGSVVPLTRDVAAGVERINQSVVGVAAKSGPAVKGLGDSWLLLSDAVGDALDTLSDGSGEAAGNLVLLAGATADVLKLSTNFLGVVGELSDNAWLTGPLLPLVSKHYRDQAEAARAAAAANETVAGAYTTAELAARGNADAVASLNTELKKQADPVFALREAQIKLAAAQDKSTEAIKRHGAGSKEAKAATRDLATAALDLQGRVGALGKDFDGKLTPAMRSTLAAAGLTERQINDVEGEFGAAQQAGEKYAKTYAATTKVYGAASVRKSLYSVADAARDIPRSVTIAMRITGGTSVSKAAAAIRKQYSTGGVVDGPGTSTSDSIPAMLSKGEYVIRAAEVQKPGVKSILDALNSGVSYGMQPTSGGWSAAAGPAPTRAGGGVQTVSVVLDVRGADTEFGRLLLKVLRTQPATAAGAARHLGVS